MPKKRNYTKEYKDYHAKPEQVNRREDRNAARRKAMKSGAVRKGDGKEVDHLGSHRTGSLRGVATAVVSRRKNRSRQPDRPSKKRK